MKFLAVILSIYILALNFAPCEDTASFDDDTTTEFSEHSDSNHDHNASDECSPFCQCHCCHIHATQFIPLEISFTISEISTKLFLHFDSLGKDFNQTILQPPRV
ncbi:DUF6660 family protein [Formosa sp. PL04]|uniref:DUF6660 family protein n=1 Tax=Formosa sp. PL04 TaxID=3081755 RepID=UPI0029823126|nr:DUF6660 family protein [Formosa sp. PL04]MDW5289596.1 DUF6660 family protein [Formosa sp. PL04]